MSDLPATAPTDNPQLHSDDWQPIGDVLARVLARLEQSLDQDGSSDER